MSTIGGSFARFTRPLGRRSRGRRRSTSRTRRSPTTAGRRRRGRPARGRASRHAGAVRLYDAPTWAEGPGIPPATTQRRARVPGSRTPPCLGSSCTPSPSVTAATSRIRSTLAPPAAGQVLPVVERAQPRRLHRRARSGRAVPQSGKCRVRGDQVRALRQRRRHRRPGSDRPDHGIYSTPPAHRCPRAALRATGRQPLRAHQGMPARSTSTSSAYIRTPWRPRRPSRRTTRNDILVQDVYKLQQPDQRAAEHLHTDQSRQTHPLWVTEWAWFTNPPQTAVRRPAQRGRQVRRLLDVRVLEGRRLAGHLAGLPM